MVKVKENNRVTISIVNTSKDPIDVDSNFNLCFYPIDYNASFPEKSIPNNNNFSRTNQVLDLLRTSHLNKEEQTHLYELYSKFSDIFHLTEEKLTYTTAIQHEIKTTSNQSINIKTNRFPECNRYIHIKISRDSNK